MTYAEAIQTLNKARDYALNQQALCAQLNELKAVNQRLTAAYGTVRVNNSPVYQNPAQTALERQDAARDELTRLIDTGLAAYVQAHDIIKLLPSFRQQSSLNMFFVLGMSNAHIAKSFATTVSTVRRVRRDALDTLKNILECKSL